MFASLAGVDSCLQEEGVPLSASQALRPRLRARPLPRGHRGLRGAAAAPPRRHRARAGRRAARPAARGHLRGGGRARPGHGAPLAAGGPQHLQPRHHGAEVRAGPGCRLSPPPRVQGPEQRQQQRDGAEAQRGHLEPGGGQAAGRGGLQPPGGDSAGPHQPHRGHGGGGAAGEGGDNGHGPALAELRAAGLRGPGGELRGLLEVLRGVRVGDVPGVPHHLPGGPAAGAGAQLHALDAGLLPRPRQHGTHDAAAPTGRVTLTI